MNNGQRADLREEAANLREKFARTLSALDQRRHDMFDFRMQAKRHAKPLSLTGVGILLATAGGIALLVRRSHNTPEYKLRKAWNQTRKVLDHTVDQSVDALNDNMVALKKYWKKNLSKELSHLIS